MKVAFASKDGEYVNDHFGWCETFYIYEFDEDSFALASQSDASMMFDDESQKLEYKIACLEDSDIVCVEQIGPRASTLVKSAGIYPIKCHNKDSILDVVRSLQKMLKDNPPLWLQRIALKAA